MSALPASRVLYVVVVVFLSVFFLFSSFLIFLLRFFLPRFRFLGSRANGFNEDGVDLKWVDSVLVRGAGVGVGGGSRGLGISGSFPIPFFFFFLRFVFFGFFLNTCVCGVVCVGCFFPLTAIFYSFFLYFI